MCGRFTLHQPAASIAEDFDVDTGPLDFSRFNIAPSQTVPVVRFDGDHRVLTQMRWGLVPSWSKTPRVRFSNINVRSETVETSRAFKAAYRKRRCLMPADGFYEWAAGPPKQPYYFRLTADGPFAFAAVWERWVRNGAILETCALLTTQANAVVAPVHHRMPVILNPRARTAWLDPDATDDDLRRLLVPYPADAMVRIRVSTIVNSPRHDDSRCIEAA
jgi:putative SOS response-associated peptidase YedK